jgi:AcrR family transcriptional regulator
MRYPPERVDQTRSRIVRSARILFNRHGFEAVSIDRVMAHAGLTRGGFYRHFGSKSELFAAALDCAAANPAHGIPLPSNSVEAARALIEAYVSLAHLRGIDTACPMVTLPSDVARADPAVRRVFQSIFTSMTEVFETCALGDDANRRERGLLVVTICVGAMVLSRAFGDDVFGAAMRAAAKRLAFELCGFEEVRMGPISRRRPKRLKNGRRAPRLSDDD